jgi:CheY-like chemotaxis protein
VDLLIRCLQRQGFQALTAYSGAAAVAVARSVRPAAILLDLRLPDTDGLTLCQMLVDSPETCGIPIIVLSRMEHPEILRRCRAAGCHFYIRKPYDPNALLVLIRQAIDDTRRWREVG